MQISKTAVREITISVLVSPPALYQGEAKLVTVSLYKHGNISLMGTPGASPLKVKMTLPPDQNSCLVTLSGPAHQHLYAHASVLIEKADHPDLNYGFKSVPYLGYKIVDIWPGVSPVALDLQIQHFEPYNLYARSRA